MKVSLGRRQAEYDFLIAAAEYVDQCNDYSCNVIEFVNGFFSSARLLFAGVDRCAVKDAYSALYGFDIVQWSSETESLEDLWSAGYEERQTRRVLMLGFAAELAADGDL